MGASAGGLEAFESILRRLAPDCGMAFVLVQHLDPSHSSTLTEILQRSTNMPVVEAQDQMAVMPNHVYVIPPNRDMAILHGKLQLNMPAEPRGQRMPIDAFMRSLAEDQAENAIGIVLSGTGTDGTLGLRSIMGAGGITLVQAPATAKFDGMPTSAIHAGYASCVLPVEEIPQMLMRDLHHLITPHETAPSILTTNDINHILMLLRSTCGHDFSQYKKTTITRRIERRMSLHNIENADTYMRYLKESPVEAQLLFKELLINVTSFFRDPEVFVEIKHNILPRLLAGKPESYVLRIWVAGCASGEEAYSIAMLIREWMDENHQNFRTQIYATDLDDDAIAVARAGIYLPNIAQDVSPERLRRFFTKEDAGYRVRKEIREMIVFAVQNVIKDPPFTKLDLLTCRNLMIYLEPSLQNQLIPVFHYALKPDGVLLLSPSESIGNHAELFMSLSRKWKIYRAVHSGVSARKLLANGASWGSTSSIKSPDTLIPKPRDTNFIELSRRMLLQFFAPASVVTDIQGNILYVHGDTGKYLRPAPGKATLNVIEMAREGLQLELLSAIHAASKDGAAVLNKQVSIKANGSLSTITFSLRKLAGTEASEDLLLLSFQDVETVHPKPRRTRKITESTSQLRIDVLEQELAHTKETLLATIEEQQVSNEELLSSNEEMQSTNEELQSTNEELETSKEELQSVNEELITVNNELQSNIEQLSSMQNDMKNLLDNVNIGIIFLDREMHIRRFTREATRVYRLATTDVGRHLGDIKTNLEGNDLLPPAQEVLETLVSYEQEMCNNNGVWYLARIQPYRSVDNVIDGVVLTFTDITLNIKSVAMRESLLLAEGIVNTVREPLVVLNNELKVISVSQSFYDVFKVKSDEVIQNPIYELGNRQWDIPALRSLLEAVVTHGSVFDNYLVEHDFPIIGHHKMLLNARRIVNKTSNVQLILLAIKEVS
ncbi:chemotaxis protein methyltransferase cher2 [mine drainage metagenome]|uniref:protein-glutamate O-methyltransferase n=1 Tax=mine drainage metagenome TaxID=410659 RepID=A0A1J5T9K0_9ZZZZ